ncbi:MAG: SpoIID/LytB domain-containing protein [Muribaculaceae bacterium]|nr:SpoIID/LytB domain-containing protein [Muribaculaceae bacterium]
MNLFRIVRKKANRREYADSPLRIAGTALLFVFLLPYVIACLWGHIGEETESVFVHEKEEENLADMRYQVRIAADWGSREMSMQEYLIRKLEIVLPESEEGAAYEIEALKAQAVLLRTQLWALLLSGEDPLTLEDNALLYHATQEPIEKAGELYEKAVYETDGIFLAYEGAPVKAAFFPVSNGQTRTAAEVWQQDSYPYLISVACKQDILAKDYQSQVMVSKKDYCKKLKELFGEEEIEWETWKEPAFVYDSAEYVTEVSFPNQSCSGEVFRNAFGLSSASFRAQWKEDSVIFQVRGVGHGFGMSQYGANDKAAEGESFDKILKDYFFQAELLKIE